MKTLKLTSLLASGTLLVSCVYETGGDYRDRPYPPTSGGSHRPGDSQYYRSGLNRGAEDARRGGPPRPERHLNDIPRPFRDDFTRGYHEGHRNAQRGPGRPGPGRPGGGGSTVNYYNDGRDAGARDMRGRLRSDPSRHWGSVPVRFRDEFTRGYADGYRTRGGRR